MPGKLPMLQELIAAHDSEGATGAREAIGGRGQLGQHPGAKSQSLLPFCSVSPVPSTENVWYSAREQRKSW